VSKRKQSADPRHQPPGLSPVLGGLALIALAALAWGLWALWQKSSTPTPTPVLGYKVVARYPHDPEAFTQGLVFHDGQLYESTGQYGHSTLRKVDLASGEVLQQHPLRGTYFGEGMTILGNEIFQLTWENGICLVYDRETLAEKRALSYTGEGWGLTHDGTHLIMSNGSATLQFRKRDNFQVVRQFEVRDAGTPVQNLNELEYIRGEIYANIWGSDRIACISAETGQVLRWIDLADLYPARERSEEADVLNGIAYDASKDRLFVTGKNWPRLFEIEVQKKG
jgi:glutamine cyclotransferase